MSQVLELLSVDSKERDIVILFAVCNVLVQGAHDILNPRRGRWGRGGGYLDEALLGKLSLCGAESICDAIGIQEK